jgi:hypothetical protein
MDCYREEYRVKEEEGRGRSWIILIVLKERERERESEEEGRGDCFRSLNVLHWNQLKKLNKMKTNLLFLISQAGRQAVE